MKAKNTNLEAAPPVEPPALVEAVQARAGHASIESTRIYLHLCR
jgi:hypothetical protein